MVWREIRRRRPPCYASPTVPRTRVIASQLAARRWRRQGLEPRRPVSGDDVLTSPWEALDSFIRLFIRL